MLLLHKCNRNHIQPLFRFCCIGHRLYLIDLNAIRDPKRFFP